MRKQTGAVATPEAPPEARLIATRRKEQVPRLSRHEAARRAGMSETRWRQLEQGYIRVRGQNYPETAPDDTLARMAHVTSVTPDELEGAGRPEAAIVLRRLIEAAPENDLREEVRALVEKVAASRHLDERQKRLLAERIEREIPGGG